MSCNFKAAHDDDVTSVCTDANVPYHSTPLLLNRDHVPENGGNNIHIKVRI